MPLVLDYGVAQHRFSEALELARARDPLPAEWLRRTEKVFQATSKSYAPMLGTALLAKATNPQIDPYSLKTRDFPRAYSARTLCKDVLVPACVKAGVSLRTTGREPLNNQPFFRFDRIDETMVVQKKAQADLDFLRKCLGALDSLDRDSAVLALAAFLRIGLADSAAGVQDRLEPAKSIAMDRLVWFTARFVRENPEGGRRGQAFVAAALDLVFDDVHTNRVNDPSRRWPGDVLVRRNDAITMSAEVKQHPLDEAEVLQFVAKCRQRGITRAMVAMLDSPRPAFSLEQLRDQSWQTYAVNLTMVASVEDLLCHTFGWSAQPLDSLPATFVVRMAKRLRELEVNATSLREWEDQWSEDVGATNVEAR